MIHPKEYWYTDSMLNNDIVSSFVSWVEWVCTLIILARGFFWSWGVFGGGGAEVIVVIARRRVTVCCAQPDRILRRRGEVLRNIPNYPGSLVALKKTPVGYGESNAIDDGGMESVIELASVGHPDPSRFPTSNFNYKLKTKFLKSICPTYATNYLLL